MFFFSLAYLVVFSLCDGGLQNNIDFCEFDLLTDEAVSEYWRHMLSPPLIFVHLTYVRKKTLVSKNKTWQRFDQCVSYIVLNMADMFADVIQSHPLLENLASFSPFYNKLWCRAINNNITLKMWHNLRNNLPLIKCRNIKHFYDHPCHAHTDSVEDGEKLIQTALDAFGRIGESFYGSAVAIRVYTYPKYCIIKLSHVKWLLVMSLLLFQQIIELNLVKYLFIQMLL